MSTTVGKTVTLQVADAPLPALVITNRSTLGKDILAAIADYNAARAAATAAEAAKKDALATLESLTGGANVETSGVVVLDWAQSAGERFNQTLFRSEHPDMYAAYKEPATRLFVAKV